MGGPLRWQSAAVCALPLPVKRLPFEPPWSVLRLWLSDFQCAQVRRTALEAVVHGWNQDTRIHRLAFRLKLKVQVHCVIDRVAIGGIWGNLSLKSVEIDFDSVRLLHRCRAEVGQCCEALPVLGPGLIQTLSRFWPQSRILLSHSVVRAKPVVIRTECIGRVRPGHNAATGSVPA